MKPPEEVAKEIADNLSSESIDRLTYGGFTTHDELVGILTAAIEAERQRLKDAEKWMRHLHFCQHKTTGICHCGLDDFRKEK
jgi:hypothetical protein